MILGIIIWYLIGLITFLLVMFEINSKLTIKDLIIGLVCGFFGPAITIMAIFHYYAFKNLRK